MNLDVVEEQLRSKISQIASSEDPAHDLLHFKRVVATAKTLCQQEGAKIEGQRRAEVMKQYLADLGYELDGLQEENSKVIQMV